MNEPKKQLVLDYVTDRIIETLEVAGRPYVSPDLQTLVILGNTGNTISSYAVAEDGTCFESETLFT
jgi:hypothetical protein